MDLTTRKQLPLFSIGIVQKLTGLTARQIRYYEQQGLIEPARSDGKQRLFSFADVERLMDVRRMMDEGYSLTEVKKRLLRQDADRDSTPAVEEPSDEEVYKRLQQELLHGPSGQTSSMFQGDLSRFYKRR